MECEEEGTKVRISWFDQYLQQKNLISEYNVDNDMMIDSIVRCCINDSG